MTPTPPGQGTGPRTPHPPHPPPPRALPPGRVPQRVLACVPCQQRKVRCERRFPCSNCVKHGVQCVPATPVLQRKKRFPERELLEKLRSHEELLRRHNIEFEPLHKDSGSPKHDETCESEGEQHGRAASESSAAVSVKSESAYETR